MRLFILVSALCIISCPPAHAQWEPDVKLTDDPANSFLCGQQCIAAVGDTLHVIFTDNRRETYDVYYARSTDAGVTWDSAVRVSPGDSNRIFSATVAASGPDVHIAWEGRDNGSLPYRRSTDGGATWLPETALVVSPSCGTPFLSADGDRVGLAWGDSRDGNYNGELYYKQSGDAGLTWTSDARITFNAEDSAVDKEACLAVAGSHRYIVWTRWDWNTTVAQTWFIRSTDEGATWEPESRITADTTSQSSPMVTAVGPNVHTCWSDGRPGGYGIWYRRSTDNGATWNAEQYLADTTYGSDYPGIAAAGRNVHVAYRAWPGGQFVIDYRASTDNGQTWSAETALTTVAGMGTSNIAATGSRAHLLLYDNREGNFEMYYKRNLTAGGVEESRQLTADSRRLPGIVRNVLFLPKSTSPSSSTSLLDISGRAVLSLHCGPNDVSRLAPGVYFLRERLAVGGERSAVQKVVIAR